MKENKVWVEAIRIPVEDWKGRGGNEEKSETCLGNINRGGAQENMQRVSQWEIRCQMKITWGSFRQPEPSRRR